MQGRTVGSPRTTTGKQGHFGAGHADVIAAQPMLGRAHGSRPALFRSLLTVSLIAGGLSAALIGSGVDLGKVGSVANERYLGVGREDDVHPPPRIGSLELPLMARSRDVLGE